MQWQLSSGINLELSQTRFNDSDTEEATSSEVIWGISPYVSLNGRGKALAVNARLGIDHIDNIDAGTSTTRPAASITGEYTVIDRRAWVTVDANVAREHESTNGSAEEFLVNLDSENTQIDFALSERGSLPIGTATQVDGTHSFSTSDISGDNEQTSQTHLIDIGTISYLRNAKSFIFTGLNYQNTDIDRSGVFESGEAAAGIGIPISDASAQLMLAIGREWHELVLVDQDDLNGYFWAIGIRWQPTELFQMDVGYAERSYGRSPMLRASLIGKRNTLSVGWTRQLAFDRNSPSINLFSNATNSVNENMDTEEIIAPDVLGDDSSLSPFDDDVQSIDEVIRIDYELQGRVSTFSAGVGLNKRSSISNSDSSDSTLSFATLKVVRAIGQSISVAAGLRVAESKDEEEVGEERTRQFRLTLNWQF